MEEKFLNKKIEFLLEEIGAKIHLRGFRYWIKAVKIKLENPDISMSSLYEQVAVYFNTTNSSAERCLRTAWESNKKYVEAQLNYNYKLNNSVILAYLVKNIKNMEVKRYE